MVNKLKNIKWLIFFLSGIVIAPRHSPIVKIVSIYRAIEIKTPKNTPPYFAFVDIANSEKKAVDPFAGAGVSIKLEAGLKSNSDSANSILKLSEMIIAEDSELEAHLKVALNNDEASQAHPEKSLSKEMSSSNGMHRLRGPIEICCGLALTNEHRFEIRRFVEGIPREIGTIDHNAGEFSIDIDGTNGEIVATLQDLKGKILGEATYRLNEKFEGIKGAISIPTLNLSPPKRVIGSAKNFYPNSNSEKDHKPVVVTALNDTMDVDVDKKGDFTNQDFSKFSSSVFKARRSNTWTTNSIITSGFNANLTIFPSKMLQGMVEYIKAEPKFGHIDDVVTVVWGQVLEDDKPVAGVQVLMETDPTATTIYFNEMFLPDANLGVTSKNGTYAIVNSVPGFHRLVATRDGVYFSYGNAVTERKTVSLANIKSSMKISTVPLRIYDAFDGSPLMSKLDLQSLGESIDVEGEKAITLPNLSREGWANLHFEEVNPSYLNTQNSYNDQRGYLHFAGIKKDWLENVRTFRHINDDPSSGTVVGFFNEENFEVYLAGSEKALNLQVVYFDANGTPNSSKVGAAGGGFAVFGVPLDAQEIVVIGQQTKQIYSRVIPVDPNKVTLLNF